MKAATKVMPAVASALTATLCYFEFCNNNMGIWDREWFLTHEDAEQARKARADDMGTNLDDSDEEDRSGEYGEISEVREEVVTLSAEGLLEFARNFAVDTKDC